MSMYLNFNRKGEFGFTCEVNDDLKQIVIFRGTCESKEKFLRIYRESIVNQILYTISNPICCINPDVNNLVDLAKVGKPDYELAFELMHKYDNYTILQTL